MEGFSSSPSTGRMHREPKDPVVDSQAISPRGPSSHTDFLRLGRSSERLCSSSMQNTMSDSLTWPIWASESSKSRIRSASSTESSSPSPSLSASLEKTNSASVRSISPWPWVSTAWKSFRTHCTQMALPASLSPWLRISSTSIVSSALLMAWLWRLGSSRFHCLAWPQACPQHEACWHSTRLIRADPPGPTNRNPPWVHGLPWDSSGSFGSTQHINLASGPAKDGGRQTGASLALGTSPVNGMALDRYSSLRAPPSSLQINALARTTSSWSSRYAKAPLQSRLRRSAETAGMSLTCWKKLFDGYVKT
eukprot:RCo048043